MALIALAELDVAPMERKPGLRLKLESSSELCSAVSSYLHSKKLFLNTFPTEP